MYRSKKVVTSVAVVNATTIAFGRNPLKAKADDRSS